MRRRWSRGFTLIELMIVIVIISLLLIILLPNLARSRYQSQWSACVQYERNVAAALESYHAGEGFYPTDLNVLSGSKYLNSVPTCPSNGTSYASGYEVASSHGNFTLSCKGTHFRVMEMVTQGFPQYNAGTGLRQYDASH